MEPGIPCFLDEHYYMDHLQILLLQMTLLPLFSILHQRLEAFQAQSLGFLVQYFYLALQNLLLLAQLPQLIHELARIIENRIQIVYIYRLNIEK